MSKMLPRVTNFEVSVGILSDIGGAELEEGTGVLSDIGGAQLEEDVGVLSDICLLYTSPSPRD